MSNFLKNLFGSRANKKSQKSTKQQNTFAAGTDQTNTNSDYLPEYIGPREFANKPTIDYLLKQAKYQDLPELAGRAIHFQSLFTIEEDIQSALRNDYPYIGGMLVDERKKTDWHGSLVCPKFIYFGELLMEVDFETSNAHCKEMSLEDLEYLGFLDRNTDDWLHDENYSRGVFALTELGHKLEPSSEHIYLHMIIDSGRPWCGADSPVAEVLKPLLIARSEDLEARGSRSSMYESIVEVYNEKIFPTRLIIREACLTNLMAAGESCVYSHRYFYM